MSLIDFNDDDTSTEVKVKLDVNKNSSAFNENFFDMDFGFEVKNPLFSDEIYGKNNQQIELKHKELSIENLFTTVNLLIIAI